MTWEHNKPFVLYTGSDGYRLVSNGSENHPKVTLQIKVTTSAGETVWIDSPNDDESNSTRRRVIIDALHSLHMTAEK